MAMFMVTHGIITQFTVQESLNVYAQIYINFVFFMSYETLFFHVNSHGESTATRPHALATYLQTWFSSGTAFRRVSFHNGRARFSSAVQFASFIILRVGKECRITFVLS